MAYLASLPLCGLFITTAGEQDFLNVSSELQRREKDRESASMPHRSHMALPNLQLEVTLLYFSVALEVTQVYFFVFYELNE